jgi:hypothetical protein
MARKVRKQQFLESSKLIGAFAVESEFITQNPILFGMIL